MTKSGRASSLGIALALFSVLVFLPTLHFKFLTGDLTRVTSLSGFDGLFLPLTSAVWRMTVQLSERVSGGLEPVWFHALNGLFHALNVVLVWFCLRRLGLAFWGAVAGAVLFAVHPIQVEAVAWISAFKDVLAATFVLSCLLAALSERWALATLCFLLALGAKPVAAVAPALVAVALWLTGGNLRRAAPWLLAWSVASIAMLAWTVHLQPAEGYGLWGRALVMVDSLLFNLAKAIFPVGLTPDYARTPESVLARGLGASVLALGLIAALLWRFRQRKWLVASAALFLLPWIPVSGAVPFFSQAQSTTADRYLYLSLLGLGLAVGRLFEQKPGWVAGFALALSFATRVQLKFWGEDLSVYHRMVSIRPVAESRYRYGVALNEAGHKTQAVEYLGQACAEDPKDARYPIQLAMVLTDLGRFDEAERELRGALAWMPESPTISENLEVLEKIKIASNRGGKAP